MFVLFTDTNSDITLEEAKKYNYQLISMPYILDEVEVHPYEDFETFDYKGYYEKLRGGIIPKTSAISPGDYIGYFEPFLKEGKDILYVHFSSQMSGTFNALKVALEDLKEMYPNNKVYLVDTLSISIGVLNLLFDISKMASDGKSIEEIIEFAEKEKFNYATFFYVDDLKFLKNSGRLNNFTALIGSVLSIKPIIRLGSDGKLTPIGKGKGRHGTHKKILEHIEELQDDILNHKVLVIHADAKDHCTELINLLKEKFGDKLQVEELIVGPTIGAHCGPSCVGVCFHSKGR